VAQAIFFKLFATLTPSPATGGGGGENCEGTRPN